MTYSLSPDIVMERLKTLLTINTIYCFRFSTHNGKSKLLESRKSKGKDQDKKVKKIDGKLVPTWYYRFEDFDCFIVLNSVKDIQLTGKGSKIVFATYTLEIEKCD